MMQVMVELILWPFSKVARTVLRFKCVYWDNGHVWQKARHVKDNSGKNVLSLFNLYECQGCGQCMAVEK